MVFISKSKRNIYVYDTYDIIYSKFECHFYWPSNVNVLLVLSIKVNVKVFH